MERKRSGLGWGDETEKGSQDIAFYSFIIESLPAGILTVNPQRFCGDVLKEGMCKLNFSSSHTA